MQEMKRRYASMYIPTETVDDQFNEHCGVCDEQGIEEAVLADRDYKYDGKVIKISKKNFSKVHRDFKNSTKGQEMMMTYDDKAGTVSVPVEFTEEVEIEESNELQAIMALDDVGIEATINKKDQVVVKKKDLKKAEAALKKSFKKGGAPELHGEEVEIDEKFNKKKFDDNEDKNDHTGNGVELVNMFGTTSEKKIMAQIQKNHDKNEEISRKDQSTRDAMVKKYYPKLEEVEIAEAKGTAYPATIDTLKMIVKDKQNQIVMFKSGQARVDSFTASAMVAVYDAMKPATKKKFEEMIKDKGGFMKTQAFAMKMTEDVRWNDQIKEDPSLLESLLNEDPDMEKIVKELEGASKMHLAQSKRIQKHLDKMKSEEVEVTESTHGKKGTFTMAPFEDLRGVADVALKIMQRQPQEVKEEEQEVTSEETPQKLTE